MARIETFLTADREIDFGEREAAGLPVIAPVAPPPPEIQTDFAAAITIAATVTPQVTETTPVVTGLKLHVDGDFLAYNAAGNDDTLAGQARINALDIIEKLRARVGAESVVVHLGQPGSSKGERYLVAQVKPYQGHRSSNRKPKNHGYLQDFLLNYVGPAFLSKVWATREADDGIAASAHFEIGSTAGYACIATKDKDMRMLPGVHVNWDTLQLTTVPPGAYDVVGEDGKQYGLKWFWLQMLQGDTADNIPGLEYYKNPKGALTRVGEKTAEKLLAPATTSDEAAAIVIGLYQGGYQDTWAERFVEQASLLWMRIAAELPEVDDFLTHTGASIISGAFPTEITTAAAAMKERVTAARAAINDLTD